MLLSSQDAGQQDQPHKDCCSPTMTTETYPIILPLSLVCRLVGKLNHPSPGVELKELDPPKGLGEQVRKLILGVDVARIDAPFLKTASDEVVPHPDVLAAFVEDGVFLPGPERACCPP